MALCQQPATFFTPSDELNKALPAWLRFSGDYRTRLEGFVNGSYKSSNNDMYLLSRLRLNMTIRATEWFRVVAQAQDSRIFFNDKIAAAPPYQNTMDLRLAYVDIGASGMPVELRVGRQELDFGDQRLIGTANWLNVPRNFDAVRLTLRHSHYRLDAFASSVVVATDGAFDHHLEGSNLHGLYGGIENVIPNAVIEPYVLWRVAPRQKNEDGVASSLDTKTGGVRFVGKLPAHFDYGAEAVMQRGNIGHDPLSAWASHWIGGYTVASAAWQPRVFLEYNFASGDSNPHDSHIGTFDQLYPTGHDKFGLADQVGWRNIRDLHAGAEAKLNKKLKGSLGYHSFWLASATDGLYNAAGGLVVRVPDGSAGTHVGSELDAQANWTINKALQFGAGIGHIFPGQFLKKATAGNPYTYPYMMLGYAF